MNLYLIRHAQSINNHLWQVHGSDEMRVEDPELSDLGYLQAKVLAQFLSQTHLELDELYDRQNERGFFLTHLYVSPMVRSVATGVEVGNQVGLRPIMHMEIFEGGGIYLSNAETGEREGLSGKNGVYFRQNFPEVVLPDAMQDDGWWSRPFEPREERRSRARRVLDDLFVKHGDSEDNVALITHAGFYNHLMRALFGVSDDARVWFRLDNAAITRVMIDEQETRLVYANRLDFLPREWIT